MKIIPVLLITYRRAIYLEQVLSGYTTRLKWGYGKNPKNMRLYIVNQEPDKDTLDVLERYKIFITGTLTLKDNLGMGGGISAGFNWLKEQVDFDHFILLEDDWFLAEPINYYLLELVSFLNEREDVGCVRLRSIADRVGNKHPFTGERIKYEFDKNHQHIRVGNIHYTTNPNIMKKEVMEKLVPFAHSGDAGKKYDKLGLKGAQLHAFCFTHIGMRRALGWKCTQDQLGWEGDKEGGRKRRTPYGI
ncbi:MAG: hypothetical protein DRQ42_05240 [Gammaproteobacteria bacterium]|nr:MAG: hypothetical protein DRQ42_05240 [Gammaproteobacteria bacterium]